MRDLLLIFLAAAGVAVIVAATPLTPAHVPYTAHTGHPVPVSVTVDGGRVTVHLSDGDNIACRQMISYTKLRCEQ